MNIFKNKKIINKTETIDDKIIEWQDQAIQKQEEKKLKIQKEKDEKQKKILQYRQERYNQLLKIENQYVIIDEWLNKLEIENGPERKALEENNRYFKQGHEYFLYKGVKYSLYIENTKIYLLKFDEFYNGLFEYMKKHPNDINHRGYIYECKTRNYITSRNNTSLIVNVNDSNYLEVLLKTIIFNDPVGNEFWCKLSKDFYSEREFDNSIESRINSTYSSIRMHVMRKDYCHD
jgi:hypothetical protein